MIESIRVYVDGDPTAAAHNDAKAIVPHDAVDHAGGSHPYERHITVTHEGIVIDIVLDGEVVETKSFEHHELLEWGDE